MRSLFVLKRVSYPAMILCTFQLLSLDMINRSGIINIHAAVCKRLLHVTVILGG